MRHGLRHPMALAFALALVSAPGVSRAVTYNLGPDRDSYLKEGGASENHGSDPELSAKKSSGDDFHAIYRFDLSGVPSGATVSLARVSLWVTGKDDSDDPLDVHRITDSWTEGGVTWNNTAADFDPTVEASFEAEDDDEFVSFRITSLVQAWVCGDVPNHGFAVHSNSTNEAKFTSKEWDTPSRRPRLRVETSSSSGGCSGGPPPPPPGPGASIYLTTSGSATLAGLDFEDEDVVGYDAATPSASLFFDGSGVYSNNEDTNAFHLLSNGNLLLSTDNNATIGSLSFGDDDLVEYDPSTGAATLYFDGSAVFGSSGEDIDGVHVLPNGNILLSTAGSADIGPLGFRDEDIVEYDPSAGTASLYFDGSAVFDDDEDVDAFHVTTDGRILLSTGASADIGGLGFDAGDIVEYDPATGNASIFLDGDTHFGSSEDVTGLHVEEAPSSAVDHFVIGHDGAGIHCLAESLTVTAVDSAGNPVTDYAGTVTLDTTTTKGTWTEAPSNNGSFSDPTADDGRATYQFDPADNGVASFFLSYTNGTASFDIEVFQSDDTSIRDDDTEGVIAFAPSGFTVTASALPALPPNPINDPIASQTAGTNVSLHLTAFGQTPTDPVCGIIESYTGDHDLKFWSTYSDPNSGGIAVGVDLNPVATSEGLATAQTVTFNSGRAVVTAKYKDVGRILVSMKDDTVSEPATGIRGATNPFVVKPANFLITGITRLDLSANPGSTTPAGDVFVAAGEPFRVTLEVRDAEGSRTPNYGNESSAEGILLSPATLVAPAGGQAGGIGSPTAFGATAPAGTFVSTAVSWSEVGATTLRASVGDGDYLLAGDVSGGESVTVGRFTPSRFAVSPNAPRFATTCDIGGFGYQGAPLAFDVAPVLTVTAQNAGGGTTQNYAGPTWWRLTNASLAGRSYRSAPGSPALDETDLPLTTVDPVIAQSGNGVGTLTFTTGGELRFTRATPIAPFDAEISLEIDVIDLDGIAYPTNPAAFGSPTPGGGIGFDFGKLTRYGRLVLSNAHDSELVTVPVPLRAEFFDGTNWLASTDDSCSSIDPTDLVRTPSPPALASTPSIANDPLLFGDAGLTFSSPGAGNTGYVDVVVDLSDTTGADLSWLRFDWPNDGNLDGAPDDDPSGRVTFGIYPGRPDVIFLREVY